MSKMARSLSIRRIFCHLRFTETKERDVLPKGFVRIHHFGVMAKYQRSESMALCTKLLDVTPLIRSPEKQPPKRNLAVPSLSHSHDPHRKANGSSTLLAILIGGFRELFLVMWPFEIFDVLRH